MAPRMTLSPFKTLLSRKTQSPFKTLFSASILFLSFLVLPGLLWADSGTTRGRSAIHLEVATNGYDADTAPGPAVEVGETVIWAFWVTNTGSSALGDISVVDDRVGAVNCPSSSLEAGEHMICYALGSAEEGQYQNTGVASASDKGKRRIADSDSSHHHGVVSE